MDQWDLGLNTMSIANRRQPFEEKYEGTVTGLGFQRNDLTVNLFELDLYSDRMNEMLLELVGMGLVQYPTPRRIEAQLCLLEQGRSAASSRESKMPGSASSELQYKYEEGMSHFNELLPLNYPPACDVSSHSELAAAVLYNLGQVRMMQHRYDTAREHFLDAMVMTEYMKKDAAQEFVVPILHNIGYTRYRQGDIQRSIENFNQALPYASSRQSESPDDIVATLNCLGVLYFHLGNSRTEDALGFLRRALCIGRSSKNLRGRIEATILNNIGRVLFMDGKYREALSLYSDALILRKNYLGDNHMDVAAIIYNLGQAYHQMKESDNAMKQYKEFLRIAAPLLGKTHRDVCNVLKCTGDVLYEGGNTTDAVKVYKESLNGFRASMGIHPEVASLLNKLGIIYYESDDLDESLDMYYQGLAIERLVLETTHPNVAVTLSNIGQIYKQKRDFDSALTLYQQALDVQIRHSGRNDLSVALTFSNIGLICYQTLKYENALNVYQEALRIRKGILGEVHLDVASSLNSIGLVLFKLGMFDSALATFCQSLKIRTDILGKSHRDVAIILYNIATSYLEMGFEDEAVRSYEETLKIEKEVLGPRHPDVILTLKYVGKLYQQRGNLDGCLKCFKEIFEIQRNHESSTSTSEVAGTLNTIANMELQRGNTHDAMEVMTEAARLIKRSGGDELDVRFTTSQLHYRFSKFFPENSPAA